VPGSHMGTAGRHREMQVDVGRLHVDIGGTQLEKGLICAGCSSSPSAAGLRSETRNEDCR
jgi:hypothetical protein